MVTKIPGVLICVSGYDPYEPMKHIMDYERLAKMCLALIFMAPQNDMLLQKIHEMAISHIGDFGDDMIKYSEEK